MKFFASFFADTANHVNRPGGAMEEETSDEEKKLTHELEEDAGREKKSDVK